jgi:putative transposase
VGGNADVWAHERCFYAPLIEPCKANQNPYIEWCNGRFRDKCLNENRFTSVAHAQRRSKRGDTNTTGSDPKKSLGLMPCPSPNATAR